MHHNPRSSNVTPLGWTADFTVKPSGWLGLVGERLGSYGSIEIPSLTTTANLRPATIPGGKVAEQVYGFLGGVRISGFRFRSAAPFAQLLAGALHTHSPQTALAGLTVEPWSATQSAISVGGG